MSLKLTGTMRVFKNTSQSGHTFYTTSISNKNQDGTYDNLSVVVQFPKGTEFEGGQVIVNDAFLTNYKSGEELKPKIVVTKYELGADKAQELFNQVSQQSSDYSQDLPF